MAGYSGKSLRDKLGIKPGYSVVLINTPLSYITEIGDLSDVEVYATPKKDHDVIHVFVRQKAELERFLPDFLNKLKRNGMIWVSWPRSTRSARSGQAPVVTDMNENIIREVCLPLGLVDVKVAAIDETWSGLKLMIRRENR